MIDEEYKKYLRSNEWRKVRKQRLEFDKYRCKNCGTLMNLQVHHKNYKTYGREDIKTDLITLCNDCHKKIEQIKRLKRRGHYFG